MGQGAQALGRGGAVTARATDPMVLAHNPAGLAELRGSQLLLELNLTLFDACVDPAGYYGWGAYSGGKATRFFDPETGEQVRLPLGSLNEEGTAAVPAARRYYRDLYDTVCLQQNVTPIPQLAWAMRVSEVLGIGFGFVFPQVQPSGRWGGEHGVIRGDDGELRPAATRYLMLESSNLGAFPNFGLGVRLMKELRIGAAFEWGFVAINNRTMSAALAGTTPANDIVAHVKAQDWFMPALTFSVHAVPIDAIDAVLAFRWQDDIDAEGEMDLYAGLFEPAFNPKKNVGVRVDSIRQNMPWKVRAGLRYADRLAPRVDGAGRDAGDSVHTAVIHDALQDERWDIELDAEFQLNSRNQETIVDFEDERRVEFEPVEPLPRGLAAPSADIPDDIALQKHWQDQVSLRLGGSYNVLPGTLGLSAGVHYETRGVSPNYMQVDFWPLERLGLHAGVTVRVANAVDFTLAYAHAVQETLVVQAPPHRDRDEIYAEYVEAGAVNAIDRRVGVPIGRDTEGLPRLDAPRQGTPDGTANVAQVVSTAAIDQPPYITNAGRYRSSFDMLALGINVHF